MRFRLCVMMFLEFFIWGGWFVTMGSYLVATLSASGTQVATAYSTQSWGAIIAPFIFGLIADRYFNAERVLVVVHLAGGALLLAAARAGTFSAFYPLLLVYMILFMPTLALVNSVAFRQLDDPSRQFSTIRVWGTVGWIVAGLAISYLFAWDAPGAITQGALRNTFYMCGIASLVLGVYSLTLPRTPPTGIRSVRPKLGELLGLDSLRLLADRNFLIFFVASILICIPLAFYYQNANVFLTELRVPNATAKQALGQVSETGFMLLIPVFLGRFGMKITLLAGMLSWSARYLLFAFGDAGQSLWLLLIGIALHGLCYDFFFVSGQIYVDSKAGKRAKSTAQGLITLATYGVGMLIGYWIAGMITDKYSRAVGHDWQAIWIVPAVLASGIFLLFALTFRNESVRYEAS